MVSERLPRDGWRIYPLLFLLLLFCHVITHVPAIMFLFAFLLSAVYVFPCHFSVFIFLFCYIPVMLYPFSFCYCLPIPCLLLLLVCLGNFRVFTTGQLVDVFVITYFVVIQFCYFTMIISMSLFTSVLFCLTCSSFFVMLLFPLPVVISCYAVFPRFSCFLLLLVFNVFPAELVGGLTRHLPLLITFGSFFPYRHFSVFCCYPFISVIISCFLFFLCYVSFC